MGEPLDDGTLALAVGLRPKLTNDKGDALLLAVLFDLAVLEEQALRP